MEKLLNQYLADLVVEYHKLQNFHWYVKGKDFFIAHAKLEELYNGINGAIDEVAENILMLNEKPLASLKDFLEVSKIKEAKMEAIKSKDIFREVYKDFNYLLNSVKAIKKEADAQENYVISALMDEYMKEYAKMIWMINSLDIIKED